MTIVIQLLLLPTYKWFETIGNHWIHDTNPSELPGGSVCLHRPHHQIGDRDWLTLARGYGMLNLATTTLVGVS